jgi:outer membrane biosynthesis protein TonB
MATETTERAAPRRSRGTKLLRWLYGSGLFAIGACLGVVIGSVSETPRLLLERLRGPVETIDVSAPASEVGELEPAAPPLERFGELQEGTPPAPPSKPPVENVAPVPELPPAPVAAAPPAAKPAEAPKPQPPAPAMPAPSASSRPVVQVASHVDRKPADELVAKLRAGGFDAYVSRPSAKSGRFRVRVRPAGGESPSELAKRLKGDGYDTWATSE